MPPQSFSLLFLPFCLGSFYTEEPPVKLLSVHSIATRFPAAASEYRDSVENGHVRFFTSSVFLYDDYYCAHCMYRMRIPTALKARSSMASPK